jgi:hypothetical protein
MLFISAAAQAAPSRPLDLSGFQGTGTRPGDAVIYPDLISLTEKSSAMGRVEGLVSFDWTVDFFLMPHVEGFTTDAGTIHFDGDFGTYTFVTPYTGNISFFLEAAPGDFSSVRVQNLLAVPEPATYGMLVSGIALLAYLARRKRQPGA